MWPLLCLLGGAGGLHEGSIGVVSMAQVTSMWQCLMGFAVDPRCVQRCRDVVCSVFGRQLGLRRARFSGGRSTWVIAPSVGVANFMLSLLRSDNAKREAPAYSRARGHNAAWRWFGKGVRCGVGCVGWKLVRCSLSQAGNSVISRCSGSVSGQRRFSECGKCGCPLGPGADPAQ